jgi:hypothetical protein
MTQTLREALQQFLDELNAYVQQDEPAYETKAGHLAEEARRKACAAHATRVAQIMAHSDHPDGVVSSLFGPGDAEVVVSVPAGSTPEVFRFGRLPFGGGAEARDLMVACTLLEHALNECRKAYSREASKIEPGQYGNSLAPYPSPAPGF